MRIIAFLCVEGLQDNRRKITSANMLQSGANGELKITMDSGTLRRGPHSMYLRVTLEKTQGYGDHVSKTSSKLVTTYFLNWLVLLGVREQICSAPQL